MNIRRALFLPLLLSLIPQICAQVVNDGASRTLSDVTNAITGTVTVGTNGSFTLLTLADNALLTNSAHGVIGLNSTANSNEVRLTSGSARWLMGGTLFVGSNGSFSTLVVSNGALAQANTGIIGSRAASGSNLVLVTGSGSLLRSVGISIGAGWTVGIFGSGNQLIVSNGGWVTGRDGSVGGNAAGSNNLVVVTGSGSVWSNAVGVSVGSAAPGRLVIEAGGLVHGDSGAIGGTQSASNSQALVTGPGSRWNNVSSLNIGNNVGRNRLVVSNGATVFSGNGGMGSTSIAPSNQVVVTGAGSVWSNRMILSVGGSSAGNRAEVSEGGRLACTDGSIGVSFGANSNTVLLTGSGSRWNNAGNLIVGNGGNGNVLLASNGATVLSSNATIGVNGSTANNNLAIITGAGTIWNNTRHLVVGESGVGNRLQVDNGATVLSDGLFIGLNSLSANNRVAVNGGTLRVTNAAGTGVLDIRRGTNVINGGLVEVDQLLATNVSVGRWVFNGGTLAVGRLAIATGGITIGDGVSPATLHLTGNGTHSLATTPGILANASLTGSGTITVGIQFVLGSTLSPGTGPGGIGRLTAMGAAFFAGTAMMDIGKSGAALTNDQFQVANQLEFLGAVTVNHLGPDALAAGDRFQLFPAGSYAGSFASLTLPPLGPGLRWATNLLVDGSIEVESLAPSVTTLPASGLGETNATLNGAANPKGLPTTGWFEWGLTTNYGNVTAPQPLGSGGGFTNFSALLDGLVIGVPYHFRAAASNSFGVSFGADQTFVLAAYLTNVAWYRLGENDPGAGLGVNVTNTIDIIGAHHLRVSGLSAYTSVPIASPQSRVGSTLAVVFANGSLSNVIVFTAREHFALELWARPSTTASGTDVIAYNGDTGLNGWGIIQASNRFMGLLGGVGTVGLGSASPNVWTHLALVRDNGVTTFYSNGVAAGNTASAPNLPAGNFAIGGRPQAPPSDFFVNGAVDEVRVSTFRPGQFRTNDLLFYVQRVATLPATDLELTAATLNGVANPLALPGLVWFEWGPATNFSTLTVPRAINPGVDNVPFNETLAGLNVGTLYSFRAATSNRLGVVRGSNQFFRTLGPGVTTLPASPVLGDVAGLNGAANPNGNSTTAWFEWGATTNYGNVTFPQAIGSGTSSVNFNEILSDLTGGVYHFRAVASNGIGVALGTNQSFTIGPTVSTQPAGPILGDVAGLNGAANPRGASTRAWFEWGTTTNYGNVTPPQPIGSGTNNVNFSQFLSDLTAGTYEFRAVASNSLGTVFGNNRTFSVGPTVSTLAASPIVGTTAGLNGSANPRGGAAVGWFEWGATTNFGSVTSPQALGSGTNNVNFNELLSALPGGTYQFRAVVSNSLAVVSGSTRSFVIGPAVQTLPATPLSVSTATLNGLANPQGSNTTAWFEWGTTTNYGNVTAPQVIGSGTNGVSFSETISGLTATDTYHFRAVASNSLAVLLGIDRNFRTLDAYLKASNTGVIDQFGFAIAMSGNTIVVGAPGEDSNATGVNGNETNNSALGSGAAYVFVRTGDSWAQQAYLKASNTEASDQFGISVAVSGDTIVVGAQGEDSDATGVNGDQGDNSAISAGAVYVFVRSGTNWTQQASLKADNTGAGDLFGVSVAASGDTIVVGASVEDSSATGVNGSGTDNSAPNAGAAYVFVRSGTNWTQQAYLKAGNTGANDQFGLSVGVSDDTIVVGANLEDSNANGVNGEGSNNGAVSSGAAYVFLRSGTDWLQRSYLKASNADPGDLFGGAVAVSGDTVVIAASSEASNATGVNGDQSNNSAILAGAAYVFGTLPPPEPLLAITPGAPGQVIISWIPPLPGFVLQESLNLLPNGWSNALSGTTNPIALPVSGSTKFFRLFKP